VRFVPASAHRRSTYPVALTEAGVGFLPLAEAVVADLYRSRREARAAHERAGKTIRFALPHSLAGSFFANWWRTQRRPRGVTAVITAADFDECVEMLLSGACHFLICYQHAAVPVGFEANGISCTRIGADRLVPVSACGDGGGAIFELFGEKRIELPLLAYTRTSFLGRVAGTLHARLEAHTDVVLHFETALVEALKAEVLLGEGVAWLPESMIEVELQSGKLQIVGDMFLTTPLEISLCRTTGLFVGPRDFLSEIWTKASEDIG
jgi:DNA-binding transcriptional LysR family regulator